MKPAKIFKRIVSVIVSTVTAITMLTAFSFTASAENESSHFMWGGKDITLWGWAHVQGKGTLPYKEQMMSCRSAYNQPLVLGTTGESRRLEKVTLGLTPYQASLVVLPDGTHRTDYDYREITDESRLRIAAYSGGMWYIDWGTCVKAGTEGKAQCIEAIKIGLEGPISYYYDVEYSVYLRGTGWDRPHRNWDDTAGKTRNPIRIEAIYVRLVEKQYYLD